MLDLIRDYGICIFEVCIFYDFFRGILEKRFEKGYQTAGVLTGLSFFLYGINRFHISQLNLLGTAMVLLAAEFLLFEGTVRERVQYFLIFFVIMMGMEFACGSVFALMHGREFRTTSGVPFGNFILISITKLFSYVLLRLVRLFLNQKEQVYRGKFLKLAFVVPVTTIILYAGLFYADIRMNSAKWIFTVGSLCLLFSNVLVFYIIEKLTYVMNRNREVELVLLQNDLNRKHYKRLDEISLEQRRYAHDLKRYLETVAVLAGKNKNSDILEILKDMEVQVDRISDELYTDNTILNALLCEKAELARQKDIRFDIMVENTSSLDKIRSSDWIVMVGNLVDNAIEAAAGCEKSREIWLRLFESDGNFLVLDIENTYGRKPCRNGNVFLTTKELDKRMHGFGISNVRSTALKYGGILFQEEKDDRFISILTLSKDGLIR